MEKSDITINKKRLFTVLIITALILLLAIILCKVIGAINKQPSGTYIKKLHEAKVPEWVDVQLINIDGHSRRGIYLEDINDIVVHYVGNPGTTAQQNRNYFNNRDSEVSSHFVIGLEGEVIQCVPIDEKSSASNERNRDTISIEVCHPDETGKFTDAAYDSLVELTLWLCKLCDFDSTHVIRHYDVTGKLCPLYFVEHEDEWQNFLSIIQSRLFES